jgi:xanthine dehydrogenase large subunit
MSSVAQPTEAPDGGVRQNLRHDSAHKHVTGEALYIDDIPTPPNLAYAYVAPSPVAHGIIKKLDLAPVRACPGVHCVLSAADIPGINDVSPVAGDDPVFAEDEVMYAGQSLFAVIADSIAVARRAAGEAVIEIDEREALISVEQALAAQSFVSPDHVMSLGDAEAALKKSNNRLKGRINIGGQDHFYLEGQIALALPLEDFDVHVFSSTQHPSEVQHNVAKVLGVPDNAVTIELRRMGGGFGGKESQPALFAAIAALGAQKLKRPVKVRMDRDDDMIMTGKRHDFLVDYDVGFSDDGVIEGIAFMFAARCGMSADLSDAICDRAMFHADNCYFLNNAEIVSHRCLTHTVSNTAFRGFGGPQGMVAVERVIDQIAAELGRDPLDIRKANFYGGKPRNKTPYHMAVEDNVIGEIVEQLEESSDYRKRRDEVRAFNDNSAWLKKGIALTPLKFGISFTTSHLNQAGALVHVYTDGSVHLNHGGTEMGQGLFTKIGQVVAEEFQIDNHNIKITSTTTAKVPNTSATAASSGSDINGKAAEAAARKIKNRLIDFAAEHYAVDKAQIAFRPNVVRCGNQDVPFKDLVKLAYLNRVQLSATGFYKTPKIYYDRDTARGRPFFYFTYGAAVSEVLVDTLTGENRLLAVDILHDVGQSLNPAVDLGQIEGGYIQGLGWLTTEELVWDDKGRLATHAPSTYKIPTASDRPAAFNIAIWDKGRNVEDTIYRSKAVGEPPLMLAISAFNALTDAVYAASGYRYFPALDAPATPERILTAIEDARAR